MHKHDSIIFSFKNKIKTLPLKKKKKKTETLATYLVLGKDQFLIVLCLPSVPNWLGKGKALRVPSFICSFQKLAAAFCDPVIFVSSGCQALFLVVSCGVWKLRETVNDFHVFWFCFLHASISAHFL